MSEVLEFTRGPSASSDRRKHARQKPDSLTYVELDKENGGIILDASESGISVQAVVSITDDELPQVRLKLPHSKDWLKTRARVVWTRESRKVAGLQFEELSEQLRAQLKDWLSSEASASESGTEPASAPAINEKECGTSESDAPNEAEAAEVRPAPAWVDFTDQSAGDLREQSQMAASEEARPAAKIPIVPLTLAQETEVRIEKRKTLPARTSEKNTALDFFRREESHRVASVSLLLFVLAIASLTAGWAAGRGKFAPVVQKLGALVRRKAPAAQKFETLADPPEAPVGEIEIENASNQHWTIPWQAAVAKNAPLSGHPEPAGAAAPPPKPALNFQIWTLTAPKRSTSSGDAETADSVSPPAVIDRQGTPEIAPIASGSMKANGPDALPKPEISTGDLKRGALLHRVQPEYPVLARDQRISGTVVLEANVGTDGAVRSVQVISGPVLLVPAATNAVRQWRYAPTLLDGTPIETEVRISLEFHWPGAGQ